MGHTNSTANLSLPQFIGTDKPTWLGDVNGAFSNIDAYVGTNDAAVAAATSDASSAVAQAASAVSTANAANTTAGNASTAATNAVGTANNAMSLVNQTNIKIGTLANLHTTDKTSIVNAINELADAGAGAASAVSYDNSGSGLTATNVQAAIDELAQGGSVGSVEVTADGSKTHVQLLNELFALIDGTNISDRAVLVRESTNGNKTIFNVSAIESTLYDFGRSNSGYSQGIRVSTNSEYYEYAWAGSSSSIGSQVPTSGTKWTLFY